MLIGWRVDMNGNKPAVSASASTLVNVVECAKTYGKTAVLQKSSLTVEPGEVLALLGPSGCGKTTLLRMIAGLLAPDLGGKVLFNAEDVTALPVEQRQIGMMFQHYALFPQMTVSANIGYGLKIRGVARAEIQSRVGELVDLVRLNGLENRLPNELSGGQKQRVALARAVAVRPKVLLLDEPLTALDAKLKVSLRDDLASLLRKLRITAIHVTHDQDEAMAIADRLAVMKAGAIVQVADAETLYRSPAHHFVAEFLGQVNEITRSEGDIAQGVLRLGGDSINCHAQLADQSRLFVRPEDIRVVPCSAASPARVQRRVFMGGRLHLDVETPDQGILHIDAPKDCTLRVGDAVRFEINPAAWMPGK